MTPMTLQQLVEQLRSIATTQGNRLSVTFSPHAEMWRVTLGLFTADHEELDRALQIIHDMVMNYRRK